MKPLSPLDLIVPLVVIGGGVVYRSLREPYMLERTELEISFGALPDSLDGFRILHVTDLHVNKQGSRERLLASLCQIPVDLIVFTGDYVARKAESVPHCVATIEEIVAGRRAYGVLGNNDYNPEIPLQEMIAQFDAIGLRILRNTFAVESHGDLVVGGVEDPVWKLHDVRRAFSGAPSSSFRLLLSHSPHPFESAADMGIPLVLAGHTHGGQICLPLIGSLYPKNSHITRYVSGTFTSANTSMFVSRGVGVNRLPVRLCCKPEITVISLRKARHEQPN